MIPKRTERPKKAKGAKSTANTAAAAAATKPATATAPAAGGDRAACPRCPAEATIGVLSGRWKAQVVWLLLARGTLRFGELGRLLPGVTQKVLTQQLRELEADGVVARKVYAEVPPKVEYSLTDRGRTLQPVIDAMCRWGSAAHDPARPPAT